MKHGIFPFLVIFLSLAVSFLTLPQQAHSGDNFAFGMNSSVVGHMDIFADMGIGSAVLGEVNWGDIEPNLPVGHKHTYDWKNLDRRVRGLQSKGLSLVVIVRSRSKWATKAQLSIAGRGSNASARPRSLIYFGKFVKSLVERYDGDGKMDMPGLVSPIRHWQFENDIQKNGKWASSIDEYLEMLKTGARYARRADPAASILLPEMNFSNFFCSAYDDYSYEREFEKLKDRKYSKMIESFTALLKDAKLFDYVSLKAGLCYNSVPWKLKWLSENMLKLGYKKPILVFESASGPYLAKAVVRGASNEDVKDRLVEDRKTLKILDNKRDAKYKETNKWYRREQSRMVVKRTVTALAAGASSVFIAGPIDLKGFYNKNFRHFGLVDRSGKPRPAMHTYKQLIKRVGGFTHISTVSEGGGKSINGRYIYRFVKDGRSIYVVWAEGGGRWKVSLDFDIKRVRVTGLVPEEGGKFSSRVYYLKSGALTLDIGSDPILVEEIVKDPMKVIM